MKIKHVSYVVPLLLPALGLAASHDLATFVTEYDLDKDGKVSKEEFLEARQQRFAVTDSNQDQGVSHEEYVEEYRGRLMATKPEPEKAQRQLKQADIRFKALDTNKDGRISFAEYSYSGWRMYSEHDYDRDGAVSLADKTDESPKDKNLTQEKPT
jgi:Ca2+-binding EF-hand superfamily protein